MIEYLLSELKGPFAFYFDGLIKIAIPAVVY
jgi:hypothetical protein